MNRLTHSEAHHCEVVVGFGAVAEVEMACLEVYQSEPEGDEHAVLVVKSSSWPT